MFLNSYSRLYLLEIFHGKVFSSNNFCFIEKDTPVQVLLCEFYEVPPGNNCLFIEDSCSWLASMAAGNQIVITHPAA